MFKSIKTITLGLPYGMGSVNCYLVKTSSGFLLFDTGSKNKRDELEGELRKAGCSPGNLDLVVLTHGDFDHSANAAYLRSKYGSKIAMQNDDVGMVERGDMSWNRESAKLPLRISGLFFGFGKAQTFTPDLFLDDGDNLNDYGLDADVISIPGHSKGSIGILLSDTRDFIAGDLFENTKRPALNSIMDNRKNAKASVEKLRSFEINTVYPGHGQPFMMVDFFDRYES